jgi:SNF2 family DNA or RNA helicase
VQIILTAVMLRRQKTSEVDGKPIIILPQKHISLANVEFSNDEMAIYKALETKSQIQLNGYLDKGTVSGKSRSISVLGRHTGSIKPRQLCLIPHIKLTHATLANYACILVLLLRLRQACCHPNLIKDLSQPATENIAEDDLLERARYLPDEVVERLKVHDSFECGICFEGDPNPTIIIPCGHTVRTQLLHS